MIKLALASAAALLAGCASGSMTTSAPTASAPTTSAPTGSAGDVAARESLSAPAYLQAAGVSDLFEIRSSQVALTKAQNVDVRAFAQMMVDHHTRTTADLMAAARQAGVAPPPPALTPDKEAKLAALQRAEAANFDAMYMREQTAGHMEALALHESYAQNGDQAALRDAAGKTAPLVRQHLERARALSPPG
jgi:putative membrane protein